ncbi:MAG: hypothetical protein E7632_05205 [Ruminococcaceae bacterium]|nr:hypothetical protein [Oscillospiraceae bacterium]
MKLSCKVIEDLMPIMHDGVCSEESRALVEEHLAECEDCRKLYEAMDEEIRMKPQEDEMRPLSKILAKWAKMRRKALIKGTIITILVVAVLIGLYAFASQARIFPVDMDDMQITELSQLESGVVMFHLYITDNAPLYRLSFERENGVMYLVPKRALLDYWPRYLNTQYKMLNDRYYYLNIAGMTEESQDFDIRVGEEISEVRVGTKSESILIWERGMEYPPASEEMERRYENGWR